MEEYPPLTMLDQLQGLREISLFTGAGGGVLASRLLGWETVQYVEWDSYCQDVLRARIKDGCIHDAPIHGNIETFDGTQFRDKVDVVHAGFPCTSFSVAGKKLAGNDARNRWPDTIRVIREVQPKYAFLENVPGLLSGAHGYFGTVLQDLNDAGYGAVWSCLPAAGVGAPHRRDRIWILASRTKNPSFPPFRMLARIVGNKWVHHVGDRRDGKQFLQSWPRAGLLYDSTAYELEALASAMGETFLGRWPWPNLLGALVGISASRDAQGGVDAVRWPTPNTLDGIVPRDPETVAAWNNARDGRTGRRALANLRQAVIDPHYQEKFPTPRAEESKSPGAHRGVPDTLTSYTKVHPTPESFPTPTVYNATGHGSPRAEQKDGSRHEVSLHHLAADWPQWERFPTPTSSMSTVGDMVQARYAGNSGARPSYAEANREWATPTAATNRKSRRAMTASTDNGRRSGGGQSSPPALEQMVELAEGIIPKELEGIDPADLPPATQALWPTPMAGSNRTSVKAQTGRPTSGPSRGGASFGLEDAVVRVAQMFPTPTASDSGGPGNSGREGGDNLRTAIAKSTRWPTPLAGNDPGSGGDHGGMGLINAARDAEVGCTDLIPLDGLAEATYNMEDCENTRGQLNPDWVELLMGWPLGWSSVKPLPAAEFAAWLDGFSIQKLFHTHVLAYPDPEESPYRMWVEDELAIAQQGEPSDDPCSLPQITLRYGPSAWADGSWETSIPRIGFNIPNRGSRLKAIGNGQVSLCAAWAVVALFEMKRQVAEAIRLIAKGPPEVDFFDFVDGI